MFQPPSRPLVRVVAQSPHRYRTIEVPPESPIESRFPWITFAICAVATVAYAWAAGFEAWPAWPISTPVDFGNALHVVELGGRSTPLIADAGESWRLFSCHFVHTSVLHLLFNLVFLFTVGGALEHACRRTDYAALVLLCAVASAIASLIGTPQVSAGSSGIVFGVLGAAVTFGMRYHDRLAPRVRRYFGVWVLPFLVILFWVGMQNPSVDHASHLGGLCAGLAGGIWLPIALPDYPWLPRRSHYPTRLIGSVVLCGAAVLLAPRLVGGGNTRAVALEDGVVVQVPARWRPRYGPLGEREFSTAGGMVVLTADQVPVSHRDDPKRWYERHRLGALVPGGRADDLRERRVVGQGPLASVVYDLERDGTPMARHVHFVSDETKGSITVLAFETPTSWHGKYAETRRSVVGSMRRTQARATLSAAAGP